jgi:hypothetical protein
METNLLICHIKSCDQTTVGPNASLPIKSQHLRLQQKNFLPSDPVLDCIDFSSTKNPARNSAGMREKPIFNRGAAAILEQFASVWLSATHSDASKP